MPNLPEIGSSLLDVALRTAIVYAFLIAVLRTAGKREIGQLSLIDLIVVLVISNAVQNAMVGENTSLWAGLVAAGVLVALDRLLHLTAGRSKRLRRALEGEPRMLIRDGAVLVNAMRAEGVEPDELDQALRAHGLEHPADVRIAILETNGSISVIPKSG